MSCAFHLTAIFVVSLAAKLSLRAYQETLKFLGRADDVKYHMTSFAMETVEIAEQYCYTMNIGIISKLNLPGKTATVILLKLIFNRLTKLTTNSCSYRVYHTNLIFVVFLNVSPLVLLAWIKLHGVIVKKRFRREEMTVVGWRQNLKRDLYRGMDMSRSLAALIVSSYVSNRCTLALWSMNVLNTKKMFFKTRCTSNLKGINTIRAASEEAVITFIFFTLQVGLRKICKCLHLSKNVLISASLMYINMTAFRYTGVMMNPTYATASVYGCPGTIGRKHFLVFWMGPIVGAFAFKNMVAGTTRSFCTWRTCTTKTVKAATVTTAETLVKSYTKP